MQPLDLQPVDRLSPSLQAAIADLESAARSEGAFKVSAASRLSDLKGQRPQEAENPISVDPVDRPEFARWFGNSKVVGADGRPLIVFHGTANEFNVFAGGRGGFYFTHDRKAAHEYAKHADGESDPRLVEVYLSIQNPLILDRAWYDEHVLDDGEANWEAVDHVIYAAENAGHDGLILRGFPDFDGMEFGPGKVIGRRLERTYDQYVAFRPEQIKSATHNNGQFDPTNRDIRFDRVQEYGSSSPTSSAPAEGSAFQAWFKDSKICDRDGRPLTVYHGTVASFDQFVSTAPTTVYYLDGQEIRRVDSWDMGPDYSGAAAGFHYGALSDALVMGPEEALQFRLDEADRLHLADGDTARAIRDLRRLVGRSLSSRIEERPTGDGFYFTPDLAYSFIRDIGRYPGGNVMPVYLSIRNPVFLDAAQIEGAGAVFNVEKYKAQGYDGAIFAEDPRDLTRRGWGGATQIVAFSPTQIKSAIGNNGLFDAANPDIRFKDLGRQAALPQERDFASRRAGAATRHTISKKLPVRATLDVELDTVRVIADLFRTDVVVLRTTEDSELQFNGISFQDKIWLHESSRRPLHTLFGHELVHQMRRERPDLYRGLCKALGPLLRDQERYAKRAGMAGRARAYVLEEMLGDIVGDRFAEESFWRAVAAGSKETFQDTADFVLGKVERLFEELQNMEAARNSMGSAQFISDLDKAREAIVAIVVEYANWKQKNLDPVKCANPVGSQPPQTHSFQTSSGADQTHDATAGSESGIRVAPPLVMDPGTGEPVPGDALSKTITAAPVRRRAP